MGAVITCSLGLGLAATSPAPAAGSSGPLAGAGAGAGACIAWATGATAPAAPMRLMRTASSPSFISISAMPDSSRSSISFLIFRMSIPLGPKGSEGCPPFSGAAREMLRGGSHRELVAVGSESGDDTDRDVGEIGMTPKGLARLRVGKMYLDERHAHSEQCVPQSDARVGEAAGIEYQKGDAVGGGGLDAIDELMLRIALESEELVACLARQGNRPLLDRVEGVGSIVRGLATAEKVEVRAVQQQHSGHVDRSSYGPRSHKRRECTLIGRHLG